MPPDHIPTALGHPKGLWVPPIPGQLCRCLTAPGGENLFPTPSPLELQLLPLQEGTAR